MATDDPKTTRTMPLSGHLRELRKRLVYCAIAILICVIAAFIFKDYVFKVLMYPLRDARVKELTTLGVTEAFMQVLKISIYAGITVSLPFILYQFWAFVMPALHDKERRNILPYTIATTLLFLGGATFAYFIVLPIGLEILVGYGGEAFEPLLQAELYVSFVSTFLLAFGLVFELPVIMLLLAWSRVVNYKQMQKVRRYAIVIEAIIAMILTPSQDPMSMVLMLVPLILLYEVGIWLARVIYRRRARREKGPVAELESETG